MKIEDNERYSAVFVNTYDKPVKIIPLGVYDGTGNISELCEYVYILDDAIEYKLLIWEPREPKDLSCRLAINTIINQQKAIKNLLKG
jgi:hypothetical protein